jgi:hypothetical protein
MICLAPWLIFWRSALGSRSAAKPNLVSELGLERCESMQKTSRRTVCLLPDEI